MIAAAPISMIADKQAYPIDALGELLGSTAKAIAVTVGVPEPIAAHSVLAVAAFAAQDKANIVMDGRTIPLSLFMLTVAESGDRKSACDKVASHPLLRWQKEKVRSFFEESQDYKNARDVYDSEHKAALSGKKSATDKAAALNTLKPPVPPPEPVVVCQEPTLEGLQKSFKQGWPSQALFSDEGAQFFGGHAMNPDNMAKTIAGLSKYWDGSPITRTRAAAGESCTMYDRRLSIHLLVQPIVAQAVLGNPLLMQQGLLARFLIAEADSLAGTRFYSEANAMEHPAVIRFHATIDTLLAYVPVTRDCGGLELPTRRLSQEAREIWVAAYNNSERELAPGGLLESIKPIVSKAGENALRIAGVFSVLEASEEVTGEQMARAWTLAAFYLQNALRAAQLSDASLAERDAGEVLEWLKAREGQRATIGEMQRLLTPKQHRKSVNHIRMIMAELVGAGAVAVLGQNNTGEDSAWEVQA
jgi:hypothetical protein